MRRREFITLLGGAAAAWPVTAHAQPKRLPVVAFVLSSPPATQMAGSNPVSPPARGFLHGLHELGWIDGRNVIVERLSTEGDPRRAPAILAELLTRGVDVVMLGGARWLHEAGQQATKTIPTVALFAEDPVAAGLIRSLARPGGNLTGVAITTGPEFHGKQLQLLQELAPRISRAAFIAPRGVLEQYRTVAGPAGITVIPVEVNIPEQFAEAFATIGRERIDALMASGAAINYVHYSRIVAFASENRLPATYGNREAVEGGGLMSYGTSLSGAYRQAARLVAKFLEGARPGDIPTEQATTFELVINARTAKALGLVIPQTIMLQADEVIE